MVLVGVVTAALGVALGSMPDFAGAMVVILTDGVIALLVLASAGGFGWAVLRFFRPRRSPTRASQRPVLRSSTATEDGSAASQSSTLLCLATAGAIGLWMLSTAVLLVGSCAGGLLTMHFWWPVVGAGVVLAVAQAWRPLKALKPRRRFTAGSLLWILPAMAAGLWLAGAVMPPGWLGNLTMDSYDVLEYHLQVPREYYHAGRVATLNHNVYSHYPLGAEMLLLLGMCLRGGPYEGMYLAKLMPGLFGVVMIAGVYGGIGSVRDAAHSKTRSRAAAVLLATSPWVIYLSGLAMVEPAQFCCLALALLWLRQWLEKPSARTAVIIGAMLGAACAVKYLSVGLVAGPVLAVMLIACLLRHGRLTICNIQNDGCHALTRLRVWACLRPSLRYGRKHGTLQNRCYRVFAHVALSGVVAVILFSPWLIRNTAATGNPVFPLATKIFGQGHFSDESAARWRDGHAPAHHPPVPKPPDYKPPKRQDSRSERLFAFLSGQKPYATQPSPGPLVLLLAVVTVLVMFLRFRMSQPWEWAVLGVLAIQMLVWAFFTRDMPARFIALAVVPISLLAAGGLGRLSSGGSIRSTLAVALLVAAAGWGLASAWNYFHDPAQNNFHDPDRRHRLGPVKLPAPTMLIGEARAFYFPSGTVYATVFDEHPLVGILRRSDSPGEVADEIRRMGITHVFVSWSEIDRLSHSYGWPAEMSPARLRETFSPWKVVEELSTDQPVFTLYTLER